MFLQDFVSFESVNWTGYYIRNSDYWLRVERGSGDLFEKDASFSISKKDFISFFKKTKLFIYLK